MDAYRKIAVAKTEDDLGQIADELADIYGPVPDEVKILMELAAIKIAASKLDIKSIVTSGRNLVFSFSKNYDGSRVDALFSKIKGTIRIPNPKTVYIQFPKNYFEPRTLITVLRKIFSIDAPEGI